MTSFNHNFQTDAPVAVVTGSGADRVGRAIVLRLARAGCRVAVHANTSIDQASETAKLASDFHGQPSIVVQGSLLDDETPERIVSEAHDAFGRIDIMVNSAAVWSPHQLMDVTGEQLRRYYQINSVGTFLCAQAAGRRMVQQPTGGSIINIGDWATQRPYVDHSAYFPSKSAVDMITRTLAVELAQLNPKIRVNCVKPGPVMFADEVDEEYKQRIASTTLTGQPGSAEHVAHAVMFLCENDFVTGVCLPVDGGRSIFAPDKIQTHSGSSQGFRQT